MRRRYGIPDTDHRPFNVAHAAVLRARQERESQERSKPLSVSTKNAMAETQEFPDKGPSMFNSFLSDMMLTFTLF